MEQKGRLKKRGEAPVENEIPDPPPEDNKGLRSRGSTAPIRTIMSLRPEIPDPPPEDNKG